MLANALLAFTSILTVQDAEPVASLPYDRVIELVLSPDDSPLEGHGPCKRVDYVAEFSGTLHLWTKVENTFDTFLQVVDVGGVLLLDDDDSGGAPTPYLKLEVEPEARLAIVVAAAKTGETGEVELHLVAAPETETTRTEAAGAEEELCEIKNLRETGKLSNARARAFTLVENLVRVEGGADSELVAQQAWLSGFETHELALLRPTENAWRKVLTYRSRTLPADHHDLQLAREKLAVTKYALGNLASARALFEQVLEIRSRTLPADHPDIQRARQGFAATIKALGDLAGARALEEAVLEVLSRTLPADNPDLQMARGNFAATIKALGDLDGARELEEAVLEVFSRTLPADHRSLQVARLNLAGTLHALGDLAGARALEEAVLEVLSRTLPADHPDLQAARLNLASTIKALGDLAGARELEEAVLEIRSRTLPQDHPDLQLARGNLALTIKALGDLAGARALQDAVLEVFSRTLPVDHPDLQIARGNLALTIKALGDLAGAHALSEQVFAVFSRTLPADHPDLQWAREIISTTTHALGDLARARALDEQVLEIRSRTLPADHPQLQAAQLNLAATLHALGDLAGARALEEPVLEVRSRTLPADHPDIQTVRLNLAATLNAMGDLDGARVLEEAVLEVFSRTLPDDHPTLQVARLNLAVTLGTLGDLAGARALEEQVLEIRSRTLPDHHPYLQTVRGNLAGTIAVLGAQGSGGEGKDKKEWEKERERFAQISLGFLHGAQLAARAVLLGTSAREAEERVVRSIRLDLPLSMARGCGVFGFIPQLDEGAFLLSESTRNVGLLSARLARGARSSPEWELLRERVSAASERMASLAQGGGNPDDFAQARAELDLAQRELVLLGTETDPAAMAAFGADVVELSKRLDAGEALVAYRLYDLHTVAADVMSSTPSMCAYVLRSGERLKRVELGPIAAIEQAVGAWRDAVGVHLSGVGVPSARPSVVEERGSKLREFVLDPLCDAVGDAERLVVALDDVLHLIPLDALPAGVAWSAGEEDVGAGSESSAPVLLGERRRIEVAMNIFVHERGRGTRPASKDEILLALGNPDFDREPVEWEPRDELSLVEDASDACGVVTRAAERAGILRGSAWEQSFGPLSETGAEVRAINEYARKEFAGRLATVVLERRVASRENLARLTPKTRYLHIATHGWVAPESVKSWSDPKSLDKHSELGMSTSIEKRVQGMSPMLLCGLALAGANLPMNALARTPGLLTAEELGALDLRNCELAVLSACDTNVGLRRAGQGVASLQKALHMAGARSVITSLWSVNDLATRLLMTEFYRRLWAEKQPKAEALWEAKRWLRELPLSQAITASGAADGPEFWKLFRSGERDLGEPVPVDDPEIREARPFEPPMYWAAWVLSGDPN